MEGCLAIAYPTFNVMDLLDIHATIDKSKFSKLKAFKIVNKKIYPQIIMRTEMISIAFLFFVFQCFSGWDKRLRLVPADIRPRMS